MVWRVSGLVALVVRINPSLTVRFHTSHRASATMVVIKRDDASSWRVFYFFSNADWSFKESCDIIYMSPSGVFFFIFLRGPRPRAPLLKLK